MKKCVIYGRVSTTDQDYGRQLNDLDDWAGKNGYEVVQRFAEKITGVSKAAERKEFNKLLKYIETNHVQMILVSELSRIGRLGVHTRLEIETLAEKGVNIFFFDKNQYTLNHQGKVDSHTMMLIGVVLDLAKIEVENTRNRIISGLKNSARSGKIQSSKFKAYGFTSDEQKNIVVKRDELKVVEQMFNFFDKGMTTNNLTAWLNGQGIPTRYNDFTGTKIRGKDANSYTWNTRTVYRVLTNRMLIGERYHKKELVFKFEPVIDVDLFERVQQKLNDRANKSIKVITNNNYLKGIIKCECGCGMFMNKHEKKRVNTYTCLSKMYSKLKKQKACENPAVNIDKLLNSLHYLLNEQFIKKMKGKTSINFDDKIEVKKSELTTAKSQLKKANPKLTNLYEDYNERLITKKEYLSLKEKYENEIELINSTISDLQNEINTLTTAKNKPLRSFYTRDMFLNEARNIIELVTIGKASKSEEKQIVKTPQDVGINVYVKTLTGQKFKYTIGKHSNDLLYEGVKTPIAKQVMTVNVNDLMTSLTPKPVRKWKPEKN